jgi:hypothetical protein
MKRNYWSLIARRDQTLKIALSEVSLESICILSTKGVRVARFSWCRSLEAGGAGYESARRHPGRRMVLIVAVATLLFLASLNFIVAFILLTAVIALFVFEFVPYPDVDPKEEVLICSQFSCHVATG